jgi:1,2-phenylacetyl-CoA epoxidase catalytic subunit
MSTRIYTLPVEQTRWTLPGHGSSTVLSWEYDEGRDRLLHLYEKGKTRQWNAGHRLDWDHEVDLSNPLGLPDESVPIRGSPMWEALDEAGRAQVRFHLDAWRFSQFLHGEQGALVCAAKIVQTVPDLDSKLYAATQVVDEARHVEVYSRYLREKLGLAYPINPHLKTLLDQAISDARWDFTYLAMQVIIEGLALAAFGSLRDMATEPLGRALNAYVMEDEARHVAFGRLALRDLYPQLTDQERDEREQFAVEACYLMRDRFLAEEVWDRIDLEASRCIEWVDRSPFMQFYRKLLFSRIVPTIQDIGLWSPRIRKAYAQMGVLEFAEVNLDELMRRDEEVAAELDRLRVQRSAHVAAVAAAASLAHSSGA